MDEINETGMEVIVLDALRHIAAKKDGNSDGEVQAIFTQLERLRKDCPSLQDVFIPTHTAKNDSARPGDDISALGSAAWDGGAQYRWGAYRTRRKDGWTYSFCLLPSRRTDPEAATPRQLTMDADAALSLGATGAAVAHSAREEARRKRKGDILRFVAANEPTSKNRIAKEVGGARGDTLDLISSLHNHELWVNDDRSGAQVWTYQGYLNHLAQGAKPN